MTYRRQVLEVAARLCVALVLLLNALAPTISVSAVPAKGEDRAAETRGVVGLPVQFPTYYHPSNEIPAPPVLGTAADQPKPKSPPKSAVEFTVAADSAVVDASGKIKLDVLIRNNSDSDLTDLTFYDHLQNKYNYSQSLLGW